MFPLVMPRKNHSHKVDDWINHRHTDEQIEEMRKHFDPIRLHKKPFTKINQIFAYKHNVLMSGWVNKYHVHSSNGGGTG